MIKAVMRICRVYEGEGGKVVLFSLVGGMSVWMVRIARAEDRALLERQE